MRSKNWTLQINIEIVDDDVFEEDEHFYLHLRNLRVRTKDGLILDPSRIGGLPVAQLEMPATATIMILGIFILWKSSWLNYSSDDDHAGVFQFEHDHFQVVENCGHLQLKVQRHSGARGKVVIPYRYPKITGTLWKSYRGYWEISRLVKQQCPIIQRYWQI